MARQHAGGKNIRHRRTADEHAGTPCRRRSLCSGIFSPGIAAARVVYTRTIPLPAGPYEGRIFTGDREGGTTAKKRSATSAGSNGDATYPLPASAALSAGSRGEQRAALPSPACSLEQYLSCYLQRRGLLYRSPPPRSSGRAEQQRPSAHGSSAGRSSPKQSLISGKPWKRSPSAIPIPTTASRCITWASCLEMQGRYDEAYDQYHKAVWNSAWQDSGYFSPFARSQRPPWPL